MHTLLLMVRLLGPVEPGPCTVGPGPTRTPFTSPVPVCGRATVHVAGVWRAVRRYGPWALGAAALAVALGHTDEEAVAPGKPHKHHGKER